LLSVFLTFTTAAQTKTVKEKIEPQVPWAGLPIDQKRVLAPLEKDWTTLPGVQQKRLMAAAKRYPKLGPIEQARFQDRIKEWAALSPDQRKAARETYKDLSKRPAARQHELQQRWKEKQGRTQTPPPPGN
jgi:hypothetical protein